MLKLTITSIEQYDEEHDIFIPPKETVLQLEHSLVSLSKWESEWQKPFLTKEAKTFEETVDYIRCMTITQNVDYEVYKYISSANISRVCEYIDNPMTATTFPKNKGSINRETITAELIYYWMIANNIPFDCQKWHLNRLLTLINVCNIKQTKPNKTDSKELMARNAALNEARRRSLNSNG